MRRSRVGAVRCAARTAVKSSSNSATRSGTSAVGSVHASGTWTWSTSPIVTPVTVSPYLGTGCHVRRGEVRGSATGKWPPAGGSTDAGRRLERLRQVAARRSTPPAPLDSRLVEEVVHGEDIRRPLGLTRSYPQEAVARSLRLQARTPATFGGARELVSRVRLTATDADVSIGDGPEVSGTTLSLLLAVSGRRVALDDLDGPGVAALRASN